MMEVEKVAQGRYRLRSHGQVMTVSSQDLLDVNEWALQHMRELESEARIADAIARNQAMELAPNEIEAEQEDEDTRKYMEHHYLGGE